MKRLIAPAILTLLTLPVLAFAGPQGEAAWFDLENCAFCKHMTEDPHLMDHVHWETHPIEIGAVTITRVDPEYRASYEAAVKGMEKLGQKMMSGEVNPMTVEMCGHCQTWGQLMMMGTKTEIIDSELAEVVVMTADDPDLVAKIQEYARRNAAEMAKMAAAE
jgi:hypothetical protein